MTRQDIAAILLRSETGEQVGLGAGLVIAAAAAGPGSRQQLFRVVDQRQIRAAAGGVETDQTLDQIQRRHDQRSSRDAGLPMMLRNSRRVTSLVRKSPSMVEVTMVTPVLCTPRVVMH